MIRLAVRRRAAVDEGMHRLRLNGCVLWWRCVFGSRAHGDTVEKISGTFGSSSVRLWLVALHNISIDVQGNQQLPAPPLFPRPNHELLRARMPCNDAFSRLNTGCLIISLSILFFVIASYAVLFSAFLPLTGFPVCYSLSNLRSG